MILVNRRKCSILNAAIMGIFTLNSKPTMAVKIYCKLSEKQALNFTLLALSKALR